MPNVLLSNVSTTWTNSGTAYNGIRLNALDTASAASSKLIDLQISGASRFNVDKTGNTTIASAAGVYWSARGVITSPADGVLRLTNNALTDFSRLQFGGTTSAFPSLKRNGTVLQARLADDSGDAGFSAANVTTSASTANTATIAASGYSVLGTDATPMIDLSGTWNTTGNPSAFKLNLVNTASGASANIMDLQVDGTSRFKVDKAGNIRVGGVLGAGFVVTQQGAAINGNRSGVFTDTGTSANLYLTGEVRFSASLTDAGASSDTVLTRDNAADTLALRRTTNPQTFNIYNTYTDSSNYERGFVRWSSNRFEIGADALGTGTRRNTTIFNRDKTGSYIPRIDLRLEADGGAMSKAISFSYGGGVYLQWGIDGTAYGHFSSASFSVGTNDFGGSSQSATAVDAGFMRIAANVTGVITRPGGTAIGGALEFLENTAPAAPATNRVRIYAEDDGAGKTRLMALFATGAAQQIAIEP